MLPTWFLSMWISNTATTAMMMPIAMEVIEKLKEANNRKADEEDTSNFKGMSNINSKGTQMFKITTKYVDVVNKMRFLDDHKVLEQDLEDGRINEAATTDNGVLSVIR